MLFVKIENNIVSSLVCSDTEQPDLTQVTGDSLIAVNHDVRWYDAEWKMRPLETLVVEGLLTLADDEKIINNQIVKKTRYDRIKSGDDELLPLEYLDDGTESVKSGTPAELFALEKITQEQFDAFVAADMRHERDWKLRLLDQIVMNPLRWAALAAGKQGELTTYRQALLDVPQQAGFPHEVVWPENPAIE